MFGNNPIRPPEKGDGNDLYIQNIFGTFQGEGPYVGVPAVFIRLGGCNLACSFCDTEFESFEQKSLESIISDVEKIAKNIIKLVVITGGEPFRQPIEKLCDELIARDFKIQIETNGTLFRNLNDEVDIVCSPKNTGSGYHKIRKDLLEKISAFKFIISNHNDLYDDIGDVGQGDYNIPVYLQPMDEYDGEKNSKNMSKVMELAAKNGYNISLQTHKIMGVE